MQRSPRLGKPGQQASLRQALTQMPRALTSRVRLLPDFLIIGTQKGGTTSLYNYLSAHPCVVPALGKGIHFFDTSFEQGIRWYRSHFPSILYKYYALCIRRQNALTGEATPYYLFHPHAPKRILATVPRAKFILLLRNPVDRAYSHYQHEVRKGCEVLSFDDAVRKEPERLDGEREKMLSDPHYHSFNHQHYSYLSRGIYIDQLQAWLEFFPKEQLLVLLSEDLYAKPSAVIQEVCEFLHLPSWTPQGFEIHNQGRYSPIDASMRKYLRAYFAPHNRRLSDYLERELAWDA